MNLLALIALVIEIILVVAGKVAITDWLFWCVVLVTLAVLLGGYVTRGLPGRA